MKRLWNWLDPIAVYLDLSIGSFNIHVGVYLQCWGISGHFYKNGTAGLHLGPFEVSANW